jgi:ribosomal protein S6--L-glutamate ligase
LTEKSLRIAVVGSHGGWSSELLADRLSERTGFRLLVDFDSVVADLSGGSVSVEGHDLEQLDGIVIKKLGKRYSAAMLDRLDILRYLESRGVRVFSKPESISRLINRLSCTVTLRVNGIPMPDTSITENVSEAVNVIERYGEAVLKPLYSTKAQGMIVLAAKDPELEAKLQAFIAAGNPVMYLQKKIHAVGRDHGLVFLGGKYLGTYSRVKGEGAWNTTTSAGGHYAPYESSPELIRLAQRAQEPFDMDLTSVDVVETEQGPAVFEVSAFGGFRGLKEASGIDLAAHYADYVIERVGS